MCAEIISNEREPCMKKRKSNRWTGRKIAVTVIGLFITLATFISLFTSFGTSDSSQTIDPNAADFEVQAPASRSLPAPVSDVAVASRAIHTTGLFQIPIPSGDWAIFQQEANDGTRVDSNTYDDSRSRADLIISSANRLSIAQAYMLVGVNYEDMQAVSDNLLTNAYFNTEWSAEYESWEITNRTVGTTFLTIDFELVDEGLRYFGRQISWRDRGNLVNLRFVVPNNNPDLLANLQTTFIENFATYPNMISTSLVGWKAYYDLTEKHMIKLPADWETISGGRGRPSTYGSPSNNRFQVTTQHIDDVSVASLDEASAWVNSFRADAQITETQAFSQLFADGFLVSYTYPTIDGDIISAAVSILNTDGGINVAEVRAAESDGNLLTVDSDTTQMTARQILDTFTELAPEDYVYIEQ